MIACEKLFAWKGPDIFPHQNISTIGIEEWVDVYAVMYRENNGYPHQVKPPA